MPFENVLRNPEWWKSFFAKDRFSYDEIPDLSGKVCIVTGGTGGLGYATVVALAAHGAHVFLACRNRVKAEEAIERAQADILQLQFDFPNASYPPQKGFEQPYERYSRTGPRVEFLELDLADMSKAHFAAKDFLSRGLPLHILVNSAGVMLQEHDMSTDGYEHHFAINHLGHFVFTNALLDRMRESQPARIVIMSSMAHEIPASPKPIDFSNLRTSPPVQSHVLLYAQSRLANVLYARALARRVRHDRIFVNAAHPGCTDQQVLKRMRASDSTCFNHFSKLWLRIAYPVRRGALTALFLATSPKVEEEGVDGRGIRGRYFTPIAYELQANLVTDDVDLQEKLWAYSEKAAQNNSKI
ncbi:hypothetical protein CPC16_005035 [Podila verticillata]|nr:hypothetical protein BGZ52_002411 [Haplosporangium bisporale]KAF9396111.1 hypothetical protein CPC16_005035 [Podila verticillata]